jgi:hypothetical protein
LSTIREVILRGALQEGHLTPCSQMFLCVLPASCSFYRCQCTCPAE